LFAFGLSTAATAQELVLKPKGLLVLCLKSDPKSAFLSESKYFGASILGPRKILLRAQKEGAKTELLVLYKSGEISNFQLVTSSILPSIKEFECEQEKVVMKPTLKAKTRTVTQASINAKDSSLAVNVSKVYWSNNKRDYLNIEASLRNLSSSSMTPKWGEVSLLSNNKKVKLSKLWAERNELAPSADVKARFEFKRPNISSGAKVTLTIPYSNKILSIEIPKEVTK